MPPKKSVKKVATRASALRNVKKGKSVAGVIDATPVEDLSDIVQDDVPKKSKRQSKKVVTVQEEVKEEPVVPGLTLNEKAVKAAVSELIKWNDNQTSTNDKKSLFEDDEEMLYLQLTSVKYFNKKQSLKPKFIELNHSIYNNLEDFKICLFIKDDSKITDDELESIPNLSKIITAKELKGEFKSYESRRKLLNEFDLFLSDDNLITTLPKLLGKIFYSTSKLPLPIRLNKQGTNDISITTLKNQINKILKSVYYLLPMGVNLSIKLGLLNQNIDNLIDNLKTIFDKFNDNNQIRTIQLKLKSSPSLPIYITDKLFNDEDVEKVDEVKEIVEPTVKLSKFEKGLVELALDEEQVNSIIGNKLKKVEELKSKKRKIEESKKIVKKRK
ncbi:hypothetical protein CANARDRAFT_204329 [[Candida] arabinofermentans NRRL YB-2248]|uniref:Ribosomal protein L1 n=1 Tax=[Candida] arabinofermentans NRRL YB-2248 TaxID=983967 RepID=A0A1E4STM2_9ASCO|nr:hypothetical protein CANARDRAFT_204329 [[Candida] arabinofermentans NRRL YB-2248]